MPDDDSKTDIEKKIDSLKSLKSSADASLDMAKRIRGQIVEQAAQRGDEVLTGAFWAIRRHRLSAKKLQSVRNFGRLEVMLTKLQSDFAEMPEHKNQAVIASMDKGRETLKKAFSSLQAGDEEDAARLTRLAFLHINLARQFIDADTIEYLLGESEYLELDGTLPSPEVQMERQFSLLEQTILKLRGLIKQKS